MSEAPLGHLQPVVIIMPLLTGSCIEERVPEVTSGRNDKVGVCGEGGGGGGVRRRGKRSLKFGIRLTEVARQQLYYLLFYLFELFPNL